MAMNPEELIKFADFHEQYTSKYIALADGKATLIVAFSGAFFGYLVSNEIFAASIEFTRPLLSVLIGLSLLLLGASFFFAFLAIWPSRRRSGRDIVFWRAVAAYPTAQDYVVDLDKVTAETLAEHRLVHCYDLSRVCAAKYDRLSISLSSGFGGIVFAVLALGFFRLYY